LKVYYRKELLLLHSSNTVTPNTNRYEHSYGTAKEQLQHTTEQSLTGNQSEDIVNDDTQKKDFVMTPLAAGGGAIITNPRLAKISIGILLATIAGFIMSDILQFAYPHATINLSLSIIAMLGATALYALSKERRGILISVDYSVLVFFAAMFVFTYGLWSSGIISLILSYFPAPDPHNVIQSNAIISVISVTLSQILSNVPFVAIYNMVMINNGFATNNTANQWMILLLQVRLQGILQ
jgi:Na+/H+ antiporter NhaD/arsenite permease-like protein